jgi:amino acid transporter
MSLVAGVKAPAMLLISFIPMLMIAAAFYAFARADPDCGQAFWWTTRGLGPFIGWILGFWGIAMTLVIAPNIANVAATYFYLLLGLDGAATSGFWLTLGSVVLLVTVTALVARGIELSVRTQYALMALQVGGLIVFATATLIKPLFTNPFGHTPVSAKWFVPTNMRLSELVNGLLIGVFFYTGWDVATSVSEESRDSRRLPAVGAVLCTVVLVLIFTLCAAGAQSYHGSAFLVDNIGDVLSAISADALGDPWDKIVLLAVFTATAAVALSMMVYVTRWTLSMASARALPSIFGQVDPKYRTPFKGTLVLGGILILMRLILAFLSQNLVHDLVPSLALLSAIEYAITAFACVVYFRKRLMKSLRSFLLMGVLPAVGGLILIYVFIRSTLNYCDPANSLSGGWLGIGSIVWVGAGATFLGVVLMLVAWPFQRDFFKRKPESWAGNG